MGYLKCYCCYEILDNRQEVFTYGSEVLKFCDNCAGKVRDKIEEIAKEVDNEGENENRVSE